MRSNFTSRNARYRESYALVITLIFIALISIALLGYLTTMRIERISASTHLSGVRADVFAQAAVDTVIARLYSVAADTNRSWITEAGLQYASPAGTNNPLTTVVSLYSGSPLNTNSNYAIDFNPASLETGTNLITATSSPMYLSWIYEYQDGTTTTNPPTYSASNPVVGRYAFWTDDESAKMNLNTAGLKSGNTNGFSDPSRVDLSVLPNVSASAASNIIAFTGTNAFNSPLEAGRISTSIGASLDAQRFSVTHFSYSPELNMFGLPRIMLTTQSAVASSCGCTNFIDILNTPNSDPGQIANLNTAKVNTMIATLTNYMTRTDWPIMPGQSFAQKYPETGGGTPDGITQLAINLIDYVRCAESTNVCVEPIVMTGFPYTYPGINNNIMILGNVRRPCIVEQGAYMVSSTAVHLGVSQITLYAKARLYLPPSWGVSSATLTNIVWEPMVVPSDYPTLFYVTKGPITSSDVDDPSNTSSPPTVSAGGYITLKRAITNVLYDTSYALRGALYSSTGTNYIDRCMLYNYPIVVATPAGASTVEASITSGSCDDPCVNRVGNVPKDYLLSANRFGTQKPTAASTLGQTSGSYNPPQDRDSSGKITNVSEVFPAPKGQPGNLLGLVQSIGELGYIHTGMDCWPNGPAGTPWRTLRLQPTATSDTTLPDWALLDLFCAPINIGSRSEAYLMPHSTNDIPPAAFTPTLGGAININAGIVPFTNTGNVSRSLPLQAALFGVATSFGSPTTNTLSLAGAGTLATNIISHSLAAGGRSFSNSNIYYTSGQLSEISGVADSGESSEEMVREVAPLTDVRGCVYSIYAVGQSVQQEKAGTIVQLGEKRYQVMLERVGYGTNTVFQPIYVRTLKP